MRQAVQRRYDVDASGLAARLQAEVRWHGNLLDAMTRLAPADRAAVERLISTARELRRSWQDEDEL